MSECFFTNHFWMYLLSVYASLTLYTLGLYSLLLLPFVTQNMTIKPAFEFDFAVTLLTTTASKPYPTKWGLLLGLNDFIISLDLS